MVECYDFITAPRSTRHLRHDQKSLQLYQYRQFNIKEKKTIKQSGAKTKKTLYFHRVCSKKLADHIPGRRKSIYPLTTL